MAGATTFATDNKFRTVRQGTTGNIRERAGYVCQKCDRIPLGTAPCRSPYLASTGVTAAEAEGWRAWACAYVEMDLEMHPESTYAPMLRLARTRARARINDDQNLVLTGVHPTAPGNYNPARERAIAEHSTQQPAEASAGPSRLVGDSDAAVHRGAEDSNVQLNYQDHLDEDTSMGPG